jgi:hypothetical protein
MRFLVRGVDSNGNVANYAETESIIINKNKYGTVNIMSYIQVRGSIPLFWTQTPNMELNPYILPKNEFALNSGAFKKHMQEMTGNYGKVVLVNLIDRKRDQEGIGIYFHNLVKEFKDNKSKIII